jgi:hypothetical protein
MKMAMAMMYSIMAATERVRMTRKRSVSLDSDGSDSAA